MQYICELKKLYILLYFFYLLPINHQYFEKNHPAKTIGHRQYRLQLKDFLKILRLHISFNEKFFTSFYIIIIFVITIKNGQFIYLSSNRTIILCISLFQIFTPVSQLSFVKCSL